MSGNYHYNQLESWLREYAHKNDLTFQKYSPYHMRLIDSLQTMLDVWTTGKYYVKDTNYLEIAPEVSLVERAGEKGFIETSDKKKFTRWLDKLFFPLDSL